MNLSKQELSILSTLNRAVSNFCLLDDVNVNSYLRSDFLHAIRQVHNIVYARHMKQDKPKVKPTYTEIQRRLIELIEVSLQEDWGKIVPSANLIEDLGADSLDLVELVMEIEEKFDIDIPDSVAEKMETVGDIFNYLGDKNV